MSDERHPLVDEMIKICAEAAKEAPSIPKKIPDGMDPVFSMQCSTEELIEILKAMGVPESEIKKLTKHR